MYGLAESVVEEAALAWLQALGYTTLHGPDIAPPARPMLGHRWPLSASSFLYPDGHWGS